MRSVSREWGELRPAVPRGSRISSFFWIQSMVRSSTQRLALFDLDRIIQTLHTRLPRDPCLVDLTGHYHQLLRLWADI